MKLLRKGLCQRLCRLCQEMEFRNDFRYLQGGISDTEMGLCRHKTDTKARSAR